MSEKKEWKLRRSTSKQKKAVQRLAGEIRLRGVVQDAWRREPEREKGRKLAPDPKTLPPPPLIKEPGLYLLCRPSTFVESP